MSQREDVARIEDIIKSAIGYYGPTEAAVKCAADRISERLQSSFASVTAERDQFKRAAEMLKAMSEADADLAAAEARATAAEAERDAERDFHRRVDEAFAVMECISEPEEIPGLWQDWATERLAREAAEALIAEAREVLAPFAAFGDAPIYVLQDDDHRLGSVELGRLKWASITIGDCRRAVVLLAKLTEAHT